jgi:alpha-galactosidase
LEKKLFSNEEVLRVNQEGAYPRQLYKQDGSMVWVSEAPGGAKYVALFNIGETEHEVGVDLGQLGLKGKVVVRDLWKQADMGIFRKKYSKAIPAHGAILLKITSI